jgi:periplasmic protein TonB
MRWLLLAAMLSFLLHGVFFTIHFDWIKERRMTRPKDQTITVGLSYKKPDQPSFVQKTHPVQKPTEKTKNPPQKIISRPIPQKTEPVPEKISPQTDDRSIQEESSDDLPGRNMSTEQNNYNPGLLSGSSGPIPDKDISAAYELREAIPAYKDNPPPVYPIIARRKGYQGTVILEVLVNQDGKVEDLRVYQSSGYPSLDDSASTSVFQWTFLPGMKKNQPVKMWVKLPVRFQLQ